MQNIEAQTQSNAKAAQAAAQVEVQKNQAMTASKVDLANTQAQLDMQKMQQELSI